MAKSYQVHMQGPQLTKQFVLLDRDGTIIVERDYLADPDGVELIPGAGEALHAMQKAGLGLCIITNQSGIARGYFDLRTLDLVHERLKSLLADYNVTLDGIYFCPHGPDDNCDCRKPLPGMVVNAAHDLHFDPRQSWIVGDKDADIELGRTAGAKTILVRTGYGKLAKKGHLADFVVDDLLAASEAILAHGGYTGR